MHVIHHKKHTLYGIDWGAEGFQDIDYFCVIFFWSVTVIHMINIELCDIKNMAMYIQILESCGEFDPLGGVREL